MSTAETLPEAIKRVRGHISQRNIAPAIGISHSTLSRVERGGEPSFKTFRCLHAWLWRRTPQGAQPRREGG